MNSVSLSLRFRQTPLRGLDIKALVSGAGVPARFAEDGQDYALGDGLLVLETAMTQAGDDVGKCRIQCHFYVCLDGDKV
jgi:hypothetical protein